MRLLALFLFALILATQYALWWGKGGWLNLREQQAVLETEQENNEALIARNNALNAEVQDLRLGTDAVEERARSELGLLRDAEIFIQIAPPK